VREVAAASAAAFAETSPACPAAMSAGCGCVQADSRINKLETQIPEERGGRSYNEIIAN